MMKKILYICTFILFLGCSPDALVDCFTRSGSKEVREVEVEEFNKISIGRNIELRITYAQQHSLKVEAGRRIINDIDFRVDNGKLTIETKDLCPSGSSSPAFIVHLSTPDVNEIRNASQFKVISTNTLFFDVLQLISENSGDSSTLASGDFELDVQVNRLNILHAGLSDFYISGQADEFNIQVYSGTGRIFAEALMAKSITILLRGFGNVHVFPLEEITGRLLSTGNLILYNVPPTVDVEQLFSGEIIINTE